MDIVKVVTLWIFSITAHAQKFGLCESCVSVAPLNEHRLHYCSLLRITSVEHHWNIVHDSDVNKLLGSSNHVQNGSDVRRPSARTQRRRRALPSTATISQQVYTVIWRKAAWPLHTHSRRVTTGRQMSCP